MIKTTLIAGAVSLGMMLATPIAPARADTNVDIGIGLGGRYHDPGPYHWPARTRISCREGARIVRSIGFRRVRPTDCSGSGYAYRGFRRGGLYEIEIRSSSGRVRNVVRLRGRGGWGDDYDDYDDGGYGDDYDDNEY
jgi:hypothetical protein